MKKDNSTFRYKKMLREKALGFIEFPVIMETHGGKGELYRVLYSSYEDGVVLEKDFGRASLLAKQRPTWAVYQANCVSAIQDGAGFHLPINFLDVDPYGDPWPTIEAFFGSEREFQDVMVVVVNDGMRLRFKMGGAWSLGSMDDLVSKYGNDNIYEVYLEICQELMKKKAAQAGNDLSRWAGYYCDYEHKITHYLAILEKHP